MPVEISVIVRTHNDGLLLAKTLAALTEQRCSRVFEIAVCDDNSTDATAEILADFPQIRQLKRPSGRYVPGKFLNQLTAMCMGSIIVFNNGDAVPATPDYLENLVRQLVDDPAVCAVFGNQLPRSDAEFLVCKDHLRAFGDGKIAAGWKFFFSLASSAVRRDELLKYPFSETLQYSEDVEWAYRAVQRGGGIRYVSQAQVYHSHNYTMTELRRRFYNEGLAAGEIFGNECDGWLHTLGGAIREIFRDVVFLLPHPAAWRELPLAAQRRLIQRFAHRRGVADYLRRKEQ